MTPVSKEFPTVALLLAECDKFPDGYIILSLASRLQGIDAKTNVLAAELHALLARVPRAPERRLREYKGVRYNPNAEHGYVWQAFGNGWTELRYLLCTYAAQQAGLTDADHAAIYALKDDPYEAVESVEDIVRDLLESYELLTAKKLEVIAARIRAAYRAELAEEGAQ